MNYKLRPVDLLSRPFDNLMYKFIVFISIFIKVHTSTYYHDKWQTIEKTSVKSDVNKNQKLSWAVKDV